MSSPEVLHKPQRPLGLLCH